MKERVSASYDVGVWLPDGVEEDPVERQLCHVQTHELGEPQPGVSPGLSEVAGEDQHFLVVLDRTQGGDGDVDLDSGDLVLRGSWPHLVVVVRVQQVVQHPTDLPHGLILARNV